METSNRAEPLQNTPTTVERHAVISLPARAIIKRELLTSLRSNRPFYFLGLFLFILILGLFFLLNGSKDDALTKVEWVRELFLYFSLGLYGSAALLIPPMAGVSICVEKQRDTYDLLRMSYIQPRALILAKLVNVLGIYVLIVIATLPIVGVFFFLVGLDWRQMLISFTLILLAALSLAMLGLWASAKFYRATPAILATYLLGTALQGGLIIGFVTTMSIFTHNSIFSSFVSYLDFEHTVAFIPGIGLMAAATGEFSIASVAYAVAYNGTIIALAYGQTLRILHRPTTPMQVNQEKPIDNTALLVERRKQFPYYLLDPRRRRPMIPDSQNPIFAKELQTGLLSNGSFGVRVFYAATFLSSLVSLGAISTYGNGSPPEVMLAWALFVDTVLIMILIPTAIATTMAKEWEWQNVDSLRCTRLRPEQIAAGKFRAALCVGALPVGGALVGNFALLFFGYASAAFWYVGLLATLSMLVCTTYALALSFWCTVQSRHSLNALTKSYATVIIIIAILPLATVFLHHIAQGGEDAPSSQEWLACAFLSPIHTWYAVLENFNGQLSAELIAYWVFNGLFFVALSMLLLYAATHRYGHTMNDPRE